MTRFGPLAVLLVVGCTSTRSFDLTVRNDLPTAVTVCLTNTGGPAGPDWVPPEQLADPDHPAQENLPPGQVIPPGKSAHKESSGEFGSYDRAYLRVYAGEPNLNQMIAISQGSPNRADVVLYPGVNKVIVKSDRGGMVVDRVEPRK